MRQTPTRVKYEACEHMEWTGKLIKRVRVRDLNIKVAVF